jgi:hypothetical protein
MKTVNPSKQLLASDYMALASFAPDLMEVVKEYKHSENKPELLCGEKFLRNIRYAAIILPTEKNFSEDEKFDIIQILNDTKNFLENKSSALNEVESAVLREIQHSLDGKADKSQDLLVAVHEILGKAIDSRKQLADFMDEACYREILDRLSSFEPSDFMFLNSVMMTAKEYNIHSSITIIGDLFQSHFHMENSEIRERIVDRIYFLMGDSISWRPNNDPVKRLDQHIKYLVTKGVETDETLVIKKDIEQVISVDGKFPQAIRESFSKGVNFLDIVPVAERDNYLKMLTRAFREPLIFRKHLAVALRVEANAETIKLIDVQKNAGLTDEEATEVISQSETVGHFARYLTKGSTARMQSALSKIESSEYAASVPFLRKSMDVISAQEMQKATAPSRPQNDEAGPSL